MTALTIKDRLFDLSSPKIMGILNVTPDSFSDGGAFESTGAALDRIEVMIEEGASIIDVGGESTRPGSDPVPLQEELNRVLPILEEAVPRFPETFFSVDTTKYDVAEEALQLGVHFINDISGLQKEPRFIDLCLRHGAGYIMMHSRGDPKIMQENPVYENVVEDIYSFFEKKLERTKAKGLEAVIIDPGIGFGKTLEHNLALLAHLDRFKELGYPLLIGASRKSMIGAVLGGRPVEGRLAGTLSVHYHAMMKGADILRVHDVKEARDSLLIYETINRMSRES